MYDAFFADKSLVAADRWHELRFADLERDPVGVMKNLYSSLALGDFSKVESRLRRRLDGMADYRKTALSSLDDGEQRRVIHAWSRNFTEWGYEIDDIAERAA